MAEQAKPSTEPAAKQETVTGHTPGAASTEAQATDKEKRKYSRGLRAGQEMERGFSRAAASLGDAIAETMNTYKERSRASSFKKRDGALRDAIKNWTKATSKGMKTASDAPYEIVKAVNRGKATKQVRDAIKMFSPPMFR